MHNPFEEIIERLERIEKLLLEKQVKDNCPTTEEKDQWFDLNELSKYDPEKRSKPTLYGYVHQKVIPFYKRGKKLIFLKSEIDTWLKQGRQETHAEIASVVDDYIDRTKDKILKRPD